MNQLAKYQAPDVDPSLILLEPGQIFEGFESKTIASLVVEHERKLALAKSIAEIAKASEYAEVMGFFISGNCMERHSGSALIADRVFNLEGAIKALNADSWDQAMKLTDVYSLMPQERRTLWDEAIKEMTTPDFTANTVYETMSDLYASRGKFFAERVDGIFRALSGSHVTNKSIGFSKRMIIERIHDGFIVSYRTAGYLSDLRTVIAKFLGTEEPYWNNAGQMIEAARRNSGKWMICDGGAMRIRVYLKGTIHIEIHPEMAWRLNAVLASLYPKAIAAEFRTKQRSRGRGFTLMTRPIPDSVIKLFCDIRGKMHHSRRLIDIPWYSFDQPQKHIVAEFGRIVESIGGCVHRNIWKVEFDYDAQDVIDELITSCCIPDIQSHQFYPTPDSLAGRVIELADIQPGNYVLEPQAGQGSIAIKVPESANLLCVEVSPINCRVLKGKGLKSIEADFISWSKGMIARKRKWHRIVMNPPFSENRWKTHTEQASKLLAIGGKLVAVLPASAIGYSFGKRFQHEYSEVIHGAFPGTSASVVILELTA